VAVGQQLRRARIDRIKTMDEAGHELAVFGVKRVKSCDTAASSVVPSACSASIA
jgi:hypothetical protein